MKAGTEVHFVAGQIFSIGIVALAILPRMPLDDVETIGGDLSHPFRKALLGLVIIGVIRVLGCHVYHPNDDVPFFHMADVVFGALRSTRRRVSDYSRRTLDGQCGGGWRMLNACFVHHIPCARDEMATNNVVVWRKTWKASCDFCCGRYACSRGKETCFSFG